MIRRLFLGAVFLVLFALGWWVGRVGAARTDSYVNLDLFVEVMERVRRNYVDTTEPQKLVEGAIRGMMKTLDPYSQYLGPKQYRNLQSVTEGKFGGIGVVVGIQDNHPLVISPIEGTPAWQAGIRSGDVIVRIGSESTTGLTIEDVADRLRGTPGTPVSLTLQRDGEGPDRDVTLERSLIVPRSVPYAFMATPSVGYVRLADFSEKSGAEVRAAVERLRAAGAHGMILDLRANPGGLLSQAVDVAEEFLPRGTLIVYTHGRNREQDQKFFSTEAGPLMQWPMVVLVDNASASASEIVAGALQDLDRALIVGRTTYGKGSVQSVFPLRSHDAALKLTTALYYTPSGRSIHRPTGDTTAVDDDDADDDGAAPRDSAPAKPVFRTAAGRRVYGGGGITPDLTVLPDSLPPLALQVEQRSLPLRFVNRWMNGRRDAAPGATPPWGEFVAYLKQEKFAATTAELERERPRLERALRREAARRCCGDSAAARVVFEADPVFQRALEVLGRARAPRDVYPAAGLAVLPERRR